MALTQDTIQSVKDTVPILRQSGSDVVLKFYDTLFERYPEYKKMFNMDRHKGGKTATKGIPAQVSALSNAVLSYAKNIDRIEQIIPVVKRIGHKHISRGVVPVHYDAIGECLLFAMKEVLGENATEPVMTAWEKAFAVLAKTFIDIEKELRAELESKAGYSGMTDMTVTDVFPTQDGGKEISLHPVNVSTPPHKPDMFVSISILLENGNETRTAMKIISDNGEDMKIDVPFSEEMASQFLIEKAVVGTVLKVSVPCGESN